MRCLLAFLALALTASAADAVLRWQFSGPVTQSDFVSGVFAMPAGEQVSFELLLDESIEPVVTPVGSGFEATWDNASGALIGATLVRPSTTVPLPIQSFQIQMLDDRVNGSEVLESISAFMVLAGPYDDYVVQLQVEVQASPAPVSTFVDSLSLNQPIGPLDLSLFNFRAFSVMEPFVGDAEPPASTFGDIDNISVRTTGGINSVTYQGRITDAEQPVDGAVDLRFRLFDASTGSPLTTLRQRNAVPVNNGVFEVSLPFADDEYGLAPQVELEISARVPAGDPQAMFETLAPRRLIGNAPRSVFAGKALVAEQATVADSAIIADRALVADSALIADQALSIVGGTERMVRSDEPGLKLIRGEVNDGNIRAGEGFTVTKLGTGQYRIFFDEPFSGIPTIVTSLNSIFLGFTVGFVPNEQSAIVNGYGFNGQLANLGFNFIVVGPE